MLEADVGKAYAVGNFICHAYLLSYPVDEVELAVRIKNSQRYARKSTACAEVENAGAFFERSQKGGERQRVEDMVLKDIIDIGARNHVDFRVPFSVQICHFYVLAYRFLVNSGEIFQQGVFDNIVCHCWKKQNNIVECWCCMLQI